MPWSNGIFTLPPVSHADPGTTIRAEQQNVPHEDFAAGLNNCLTRDGSTTMLANLPMNGRKIVNLAQGTAASDAVRVDQLPASSEWLEAVAALTMAADRFPYATGPNAAALATLTAFARTLLDDPDAATARATLGLTIATAALAVLNAAADHNTAAWQAGAATTPGFPSPAQLRAATAAYTDRVVTAEQSLASGSGVTLTGIPSWATEIIIHLRGVSLTNADWVQVQIGGSGGLKTSGYEGGSAWFFGNATGQAPAGAGFAAARFNSASDIWGQIALRKGAGNDWSMSAQGYGPGGWTSGGFASLPTVLDRLRVMSTGVGTFNGGSFVAEYRR